MTAPFVFRFTACDVAVFPACQWAVVSGANEGDTLDNIEGITLGDWYQLSREAQHRRLALVSNGPRDHCVARDSQIGVAGSTIRYDATLTFMAESGEIFDAILLAELIEGSPLPNLYLAPLISRINAEAYSLIRMEKGGKAVALAKAAAFSANDVPITPASAFLRAGSH